jgi:pimeloyl-ACP methyl ester carboxylesterase
MHFTEETQTDGVIERNFSLNDVTGALWSPTSVADRAPLVLIAHGGGQHKHAPGVVGRARRFMLDLGFHAAAIDAPGHGERTPAPEFGEHLAVLRRAQATGEPISPIVADFHTYLAEQAVPEWRATIDALQSVPEIGPDGPVGFWGIMQGTGIGVPLTAAEPRITAAVFGCLGHEGLTEAAAQITVPLEFLLQWDDALVARQSGLDLFDAFASKEKSLHINAGGHADVPRFEVDSATRFFARHLGGAGTPTT